MKLIFTTIFIAITSMLSAQVVSDIVTTGEGYTNQIWYSLANGEVGNAPKDNWDLAFEISGFTASIRYNEQKGMAVYASPYSIADWAAVDTTGMANNWEVLHDDPKSWERGAFNMYSSSDFDLGWGIYNVVTHVIAGDSIYVVKLANGNFKKLRIDNLAAGTYNFTYADIDGQNEISAALVKSQFSGKNFGYYNLETNEVVDREPLSEDWDITFTKYIDLVGPDATTPYGVTGILQNYTAETAEATETPVDDAVWSDFSFSDEINVIGYDWKYFDFSLGYVITENLSYFVMDQNGSVYQVVFTGFDGTSTGIYEFTVEEVGTVGITEIDIYNLRAFPNPSQGENVNIHWDFGDFSQLRLIDLSGKLVLSQNISSQSHSAEIPTSQLASGVYILQLQGASSFVNQKLVFNN